MLTAFNGYDILHGVIGHSKQQNGTIKCMSVFVGSQVSPCKLFGCDVSVNDLEND